MKKKYLGIISFSIIILFFISGFSIYSIGKNASLPSQISTPPPGIEELSNNDDICSFVEPVCEDTEAEFNNVAYDLTDAEKADVTIILFWMQDCAHCAEILNTVLPEMNLIYQEKVFFFPIELKEIGEIDLFYQMAERLGVQKNNIGVPLMIIGSQVLAGDQINDSLQKSIESYIDQPAYSFVAIPEFEEKLPETIRNKQATFDASSNPLSRTNTLLFVIGAPLLLAGIVAIIIIVRKNRPA